jgi:hypothetical protein
MKFDDQHKFSKPPATLLKMFTDRSYFERKYPALPGVKNFEILECETKGTQFHIKHRSSQKADIPLPDFAKKFVSDSMVVTQTDSWDTATGVGRLDVEVKGMPMKISADMKVEASGKGSTNSFKWNISSGIPLIGGKLERLLADDIKTKSATDLSETAKILKYY